MPAKFGCSQTVVSKGGYRHTQTDTGTGTLMHARTHARTHAHTHAHTHTHTHTVTLHLYIVDSESLF